jgi:hypothetical protein
MCYNQNMKHYICTGGCGGVSEKPGVCQAIDCPKYGKPLEECDCEDKSHKATSKSKEEKETPKS